MSSFLNILVVVRYFNANSPMPLSIINCPITLCWSHAGYGRYKVCTTDSEGKRVCSNAIDASGWCNKGLTYFERATRYTKYMITGKEPKRTLPMMPDPSTSMHITDKGRYVFCYVHFIQDAHCRNT
jgi:hypothetical protein